MEHVIWQLKFYEFLKVKDESFFIFTAAGYGDQKVGLEEVLCLQYLGELRGRLPWLSETFWLSACSRQPKLCRLLRRFSSMAMHAALPCRFTQRYLVLNGCHCIAISEIVKCLFLAKHALPDTDKYFWQKAQKYLPGSFLESLNEQ